MDNEKKCACEKSSCGCAGVKTERCVCGERCVCAPSCRCGGGCDCATKK